jgi:hypothetical protein
MLPLLRQHEGQSVFDDTSIVIVKRVISGCSTTTSMIIACTPFYFHRRYHMRRILFLSIMHKLSKTSPYFYKMCNATGRDGLTVL